MLSNGPLKNCERSLSRLVVALLCAAVLGGCDRSPKAIPVGFIGGLSTKTSDLGVTGRDGTILAVEEFNRRGGLDGRPIELLVYDDEQNPVKAASAFTELTRKGAVAVIGPMTSSMCEAVWPLANQAGLPLISPTCSSMLFDQREDAFFRVYPTCQTAASTLARFAVRELGLKQVAILLDTSNESFTRNWGTVFTREFVAQGGDVSPPATFHSKQKVDFLALAEHVAGGKPQGILILANPADTGLLAQQFGKLGSTPKLLVSEWSLTGDLATFSGSASDLIVGVQNFNPQRGFRDHPSFHADFQRRFGFPPNFAAAYGYESTQVLIKALRKGAKRDAVLKNLKETGTLDGVINRFSLSGTGDVERPVYVVHFVDGNLKSY